MSQEPKRTKKVVDVKSDNAVSKGESGASKSVWTPTPEAKSKATRFRIFSWILWVAAIGLEVFAIVWILRQDPLNMWLLIGAILVIGVLALGGNLLWKQANRLDPASKSNPTKFFIQNQLGAIMTAIAFLPLVIFIFTDKNMDGKQKAVAGGLGAVLAVVIALASGVSWDGGPSQEQYAEEESIITALTGEDVVYWTKSGKVFHVCEAVPDVNRDSKDGSIYRGSVADAHAAGKERLTQKWESEALNYCGYTEEQVAVVRNDLDKESQKTLTDKDSTEQSE